MYGEVHVRELSVDEGGVAGNDPSMKALESVVVPDSVRVVIALACTGSTLMISVTVVVAILSATS